MSGFGKVTNKCKDYQLLIIKEGISLDN